MDASRLILKEKALPLDNDCFLSPIRANKQGVALKRQVRVTGVKIPSRIGRNLHETYVLLI